MSKQTVEFKGNRDGVTIYCLDHAEFSDILSDLAKRLKKRAAFFGEAPVRIDVGQREITEAEKQALCDVIKQNSRLHLTAIQSAAERPPAVAAARRQGETDDLRLDGFKEGRAIVIKRTLRSGQYVRFPGHVIVLGDVNPGAEIVADRDIFVFGTLRVAHAGVNGDRGASVVALRLAQHSCALPISPGRRMIPVPEQPRYAYVGSQA